ncbi:TetR-like C-terminal domain-containing protein [Demequina capsici]|uniref:TetR-like C-terminal domain-containing protein n=1 Tax=Demequina capsici TaxID=3075620 RepID=A0AA96F8X3_9MICO|nr:TetR-like C-terminal domain-containing protein [Demequina sp. OYTSA14]WNM24191.1 TetR-like C-terminal domain-containing protein [Demequina sp. OYTSA14]
MPRQGLTAAAVTVAAADLADRIGFARLSLSELARTVGVRTASLYSHVRDLDDLRCRVALLALDELATATADGMVGRSGKNALAALADTYRSYAAARPGRYAATRMRLDADTASVSAGPRHAGMLRAIVVSYGVPDAEQVHAIRFIGGAIHGYIELEAAGGFDHSSPDSQVSWIRALDAIDAALRAWPHP